jgi:hypothetical protein
MNTKPPILVLLGALRALPAAAETVGCITTVPAMPWGAR